MQGLTKPVVFGFIVATVGCYQGLNVKGGTQGVGRATTQAVVTASVFILITNFFLTKLMLSLPDTFFTKVAIVPRAAHVSIYNRLG